MRKPNYFTKWRFVWIHTMWFSENSKHEAPSLNLSVGCKQITNLFYIVINSPKRKIVWNCREVVLEKPFSMRRLYSSYWTFCTVCYCRGSILLLFRLKTVGLRLDCFCRPKGFKLIYAKVQSEYTSAYEMCFSLCDYRTWGVAYSTYC